MNDCMTDLETLGTTPQCPVISIGAQFFDIQTTKLGGTFYMVLDVSEQIERGRKPTGDTIRWWMTQSEAAKRVFHDKAKPVAEVLQLFSGWYKQNSTLKGGAYVWGNGSTFDISILEDIYRDYKLPCPWGYNKAMDLRTFKRFVGVGAPVAKGGVNHNALDDAISEATYVLECAKAKAAPPSVLALPPTNVQEIT